MKKFVIVAGILLLVLAFAGCTGGGGETKAPATTQPPATEAPKEPVGEEAPGYAEVAEIHGKGKCDQCHDAPTFAEMRTGLHKEAFEKFEGHKNLCKDCHSVQTFCAKCHALPAVMQQ